MEILVKRNVRRRIKVDATIIMIGDGLMELSGMIPTSKLREMDGVRGVAYVYKGKEVRKLIF